MIATIVDTSALLNVVVASLIVTVGGTAAFSVGIIGATRFDETRRERRLSVAAFYAALAVVALGTCVGAVALGIVVMVSK